MKKGIKTVLVIGASIITYIIMAFLGAFSDNSVVGSIFILFGWYWLLMGQIMMLYVVWRK